MQRPKPPGDGIVLSVCPHDCPDTCSILSHVKGGKLVKVEGNPQHPVTRGFLCPKVRHYPERVYSPERVLYPMKRVGPRGSGRLERISWGEAVETIASRWKAIIAREGPRAILPYYGSGTLGMVHGKLVGKRFFNRLGTLQLDRTICTKAGRVGYLYTMGSSEGADPRGIPYSRLVIAWGTNTFSTNVHQLPFLREARRKGALYAVVNPFRVKGAEVADLFLQPRPGSDAALALGMMHVIIKEGLFDRDFVSRSTSGFEELQGRVEEYPLERAEELTDIEAKKIREFARLYAASKPSFIYVGSGCQHHTNGGMTLRTLSCLPALVGTWGRPGGGIFFPTSTIFPVDWDYLEGEDLRPNPPASFNMNSLGEILTNGNPRISSLYVFNANPMAVLFNQNRLLAGLLREDLFTVVHELFFTDTAYYADMVLPSTTQFEQVDLHASYYHLSLQLSQQAISPQGECKSNLETFSLLARAMGFEDPCFKQDSWDVIGEMLSARHPALEGITLERLIKEGHAPLNLEIPYVPFKAGSDRSESDGRFPTPSGKIEFYSQKMEAEGLDPLPAHIPLKEGRETTPALYERYPLYLLTPSAHSLLNSNFASDPWMHNSDGRGTARRAPTIIINPKEAASRGIKDGNLVRVFNDRGSCLLWASVEDRVKPGVVVSLGQWWSRQCPGGKNANCTTPDFLADMGGGSAFNTNLVQIEKAVDSRETDT
ncbi:MAG: molybdopterin oxidoreductase family protein [Candidatus Brocadiaceae bacterium]|nr:molybdopterin oxidoreductase family protein [Candidatus Brocadiaceae bacterium]